MTKKVNLDWKNLGFSYIKTDYRYISYYKDMDNKLLKD